MKARLLVEIDGNIAIVRLNRPDKNNAIDLEMFEAFIETGGQLAVNKTLRAVVLTGAGEHFCAGIDLSVFQGAGIDAVSGGLMEPGKTSPANFFQSAAYVWREIPVPVIAAMRGVVYGGGLQIALGADIRYATADARLSVMEVKWGIIPDMAITSTAQHVIPLDRLKELAYTGRVISGVEALEQGLITAIKDNPLEAATDLAREIALRSPEAIRAIKKLFDESWHTGTKESLQFEAKLQKSVMGTPNQIEAVTANLQKRKPQFKDP